MIDNNSLACSPEDEQLQLEYEVLVEEYTALVSQYQDMVDHQSPHLSALYMRYFGKLLNNQLRLALSLSDLRLRRSLLQAYINRDEAPNLAEIDKQMAQQSQLHREMLQKREAELQLAKAYWDAPHLSPEESKEIKELYKELVKRLHPDLNPHYTREDKKLFLATVSAYKRGDLLQLQAIHTLLDKDQHKELPIEPEKLSVEIEKLRKKLRVLERKRAKLLEEHPFNQQELLLDERKVQERQASLEERTKQLEAAEHELQLIVTMMEEYKSQEL